jgi:hypothetical protein
MGVKETGRGIHDDNNNRFTYSRAYIRRVRPLILAYTRFVYLTYSQWFTMILETH